MVTSIWATDAGTSLIAALVLGVLGLVMGSFLNVVIHRLPKMLERRWLAECREMLSGTDISAPIDHREGGVPAQPYNLMVPRSACPHCGFQLRWWENIPLLGYISLQGRCSCCFEPIGVRYPLVEAVTAILFAWCGWRFGLTAHALAWCGFAAALVALAAIDWDTTLLPDDITLPLIWGGLIASASGLTHASLHDSVWGAVAGYLALWSIYWAFKLATGKEGMGYGDFKLFAALGAWFGWEALPLMILLSSVAGAVAGLIIKLRGELREGGCFPFGPFIAISGLLGLLFPTLFG